MKFFKKIKSEKASVTIEASVAMVTFTLVIVFLLTFVKVGRAQAFIQSAINKSCMELSQYMYIYEATGLYYKAVDFDGSGEKSLENASNISSSTKNLYSGVDSLFSNVSTGASGLGDGDYMNAIIGLAGAKGDYDSITANYDTLKSSVGDIKDNPLSFIKGLGKTGLGAGNSYLFGSILAQSLTENYLGADGDGSSSSLADKKLKSLGVVDGLDGLNFKMSSVFETKSPTNINIIVTYKVKIFPMLGDFSVTFAQSASSRAWLGGDGTVIVGTKGKKTEEQAMANSTTSTPETTSKTEITSTTSAMPDENGNFG